MSVKCPNCDATNTLDSQFFNKCASPFSLSVDPSVTKTLETPAKGLSVGSFFAERYEII